MSNAADAPRDDHGRRRLTPDERDALLDLPLTAVWSTLSASGWIHSVPVHFLPVDGELRVLTEWDSVKCRNARRTGRATLCVEATFDGRDRRYAMAEGPVRVERRVTPADVAALDRRYGRQDAGDFDAADYADSVMVVLTPERWIAWSDAD
jgi:Pyridoxamine 5'-phosphate oxidase